MLADHKGPAVRDMVVWQLVDQGSLVQCLIEIKRVLDDVRIQKPLCCNSSALLTVMFNALPLGLVSAFWSFGIILCDNIWPVTVY